MIAAQQSDVKTDGYDRARHIFAVFIAGAIFTLILAGALVTSNDAGLSVPDWPTSFGSICRIPPMVGGVRFEHGHRMLAEFVGLLTIILALWAWRTDERRWMRSLGIAALAVVIMQGACCFTVLYFLPPAVSTAHAALGQTFFCITVIIAIFTGRTSVSVSKVFRLGARRVARLALISVGVLYVQLILGGLFRHGRPDLVAARGELDRGDRDAHLDHFSLHHPTTRTSTRFANLRC